MEEREVEDDDAEAEAADEDEDEDEEVEAGVAGVAGVAGMGTATRISSRCPPYILEPESSGASHSILGRGVAMIAARCSAV